jgi:DNA repair exonuclease SbcCD ATPase subunit
MAKKLERAKLSFPQMRKVDLESFTLFAQQPNVSLDFKAGVTCLAGANGIGKSTFLSAVTYCLTGRVPTPYRAYRSSDEYFRDSQSFPKTYFDGRISELNRETASVAVEFELGSDLFSVKRALFDADGLRALSITRKWRSKNPQIIDGTNLSDSDRQAMYSAAIVAASGLKSFDQFVFLYHFVLVFDESPTLLFWNPKALEAALFLAFGNSPDQLAAADNHRREMERAESLGRNAKWQSLQVHRRIDAIRESLGADNPAQAVELEEVYERVRRVQEQAATVLDDAEARAADAELDLANAVARLVSARNEYAKAFEEFVGTRSALTQHPLVLQAQSDNSCGICGSVGESVGAHVRARLSKNVCPLCDSQVKPAPPKGDLGKLREVDGQIAQARVELEASHSKRERLVSERDEARKGAIAAANAVREFEERHVQIVKWVQGKQAVAHTGVEEELSRLSTELHALLQTSKQHYAVRDKHKAALLRLQQQLEQQYRSTEEEFVPLFRDLAEQFIGFELDIEAERKQTGFVLVLELKGARRRGEHQLSQSQRFFLDIALRMALARFMSTDRSAAPLFIDTPEGSLDIAYEARAGQMFAAFVSEGHDIVMTANINTSQLLLKLAAACGASQMSLVRMTDWADLSEVQLMEEGLFHKAYAAIEEHLAGDVQ